MKKILGILTITLFNLACVAQTVSLEAWSQCRISPLTCPIATYINDKNNLLDKYVGTWVGALNGKQYKLKLIKKVNSGKYLKMDRLVGRLKITTSSGSVEYNDFNKADDQTNLLGVSFQSNLKKYLIYFSGGKLDCVDYGYIYVSIQPGKSKNLFISFAPDNDIVTENCTNFQTTLPSDTIIELLKQ